MWFKIEKKRTINEMLEWKEGDNKRGGGAFVRALIHEELCHYLLSLISVRVRIPE